MVGGLRQRVTPFLLQSRASTCLVSGYASLCAYLRPRTIPLYLYNHLPHHASLGPPSRKHLDLTDQIQEVLFSMAAIPSISDFTPRSYQNEIFDKARDHNIVCAMETGSGKVSAARPVAPALTITQATLSLDYDSSTTHQMDSIEVGVQGKEGAEFFLI